MMANPFKKIMDSFKKRGNNENGREGGSKNPVNHVAIQEAVDELANYCKEPALDTSLIPQYEQEDDAVRALSEKLASENDEQHKTLLQALRKARIYTLQFNKCQNDTNIADLPTDKQKECMRTCLENFPYKGQFVITEPTLSE